jgi:hypothetical protein
MKLEEDQDLSGLEVQEQVRSNNNPAGTRIIINFCYYFYSRIN